MAVIPESVELHWAGSTGNVDQKKGPTYLALWRVKVDDPLDQSKTILDWWQLNEFPLGTSYEYANDTAGSSAIAKNIAAKRQEESGVDWVISVQYERLTSETEIDIGGDPTDDPLEERCKVNCSSNAQTIPGDNLIYISGYSPRMTAKLQTGLPMVPVSSNMKPFDPLPEIEQYLWYLSIEQNVATFNANQANVGFINNAIFQVNYLGLTLGPVLSFQAKIRDCEVALSLKNSISFWKVRYYIEIKPNGEDYLIRTNDIGMDSFGCPGVPPIDPDLHGGVIGQTPPETPVIAGRAASISIIDAHGMPIRSPVLLDGDGHALDVCQTPIVPVVSLWKEGKEVDFTQMPVLDCVISEVPP